MLRRPGLGEVLGSAGWLESWIVLTRDNYIRFRAVEVNALISGKVRAFVLTARGELNGAEIGEIFVKALPAMKKLCQTIPAPFVAHVHKDGTVTLMKSGSQ